jgi:hypothetical protein
MTRKSRATWRLFPRLGGNIGKIQAHGSVTVLIQGTRDRTEGDKVVQSVFGLSAEFLAMFVWRWRNNVFPRPVKKPIRGFLWRKARRRDGKKGQGRPS